MSSEHCQTWTIGEFFAHGWKLFSSAGLSPQWWQQIGSMAGFYRTQVSLGSKTSTSLSLTVCTDDIIVDLSLYFPPQPRLQPRLWRCSCKSFSHRPRGFCRSCRQGRHISWFNRFSHFAQPGDLFTVSAALATSDPTARPWKDSSGWVSFHSAPSAIGKHCILDFFLLLMKKSDEEGIMLSIL